MAASRSRRLQCPIDYALETFGDRWTLLVVRDLLLARKRHYRELIASKEGIATNILADRLKKLERAGIVKRSKDPEDRRQVVYSLTDKGIDLIPVLLEIGRWSARHAKTAADPAWVERLDADRDGEIARLTAMAREHRKQRN